MSVKGIDVAAGVINRDYCSELKVLLHNYGSATLEVTQGDCITQLVIKHIATVDIIQVDTLDATNRGTQGFGSTGS